jgi:hypothetical protein
MKNGKRRRKNRKRRYGNKRQGREAWLTSGITEVRKEQDRHESRAENNNGKDGCQEQSSTYNRTVIG